MLASAAQIAFRSDGLIHFVQNGLDLPRGPLGVLLYLPFALAYPRVPVPRRPLYLVLTSLGLALITLGPGYAATLTAMATIGIWAARVCHRRNRVALGVVILSVIYTALILFPQPPWLPPIDVGPLYFYLHWAGLGYIFLRSIHVLVDVSAGRMPLPGDPELLAYLLFGPTVRMGPIYRYPEFATQLAGDPRAHRDFGASAIRIMCGLVRLGIMAAILGKCPIERLFEHPETLSPGRLAAGIYVAPMSIYLWISGYLDLSVGVGLAMGFRVPENFCYPWKSTSLAEFWRRWHITLGLWLRDYIYIPLGGSRRHVFFNYFVAFLFCGVWHGLCLSYAIWGITQGVGLGVRRIWSEYWRRQREAATPLYKHLSSLRLVNSPLNVAVAWFLTFHYQILTIAWFMDEKHAGRLLAARLWRLIWGPQS